LLARYRLEIKYCLLTILLISGLIWLASNHALDGLQGSVDRFMDDMAGLGIVGVFLVALIANGSLLIQVPYTLPMLSVALYSDNLLELVALGVATGVGAGLGEIVSYAIAYNIAAQIQELSKSALFRWIRRTIHEHPGSIPILVFIGALFPIPDDLVIMPLAMISYPIRKLMFPMFTGKIIHNLSVAFVFHYATDSVADQVRGDVDVDLSLGILIVFVLIIAYQVEKVRQKEDKSAA
jgi:membrane protein DedA with SNARE-associated domain